MDFVATTIYRHSPKCNTGVLETDLVILSLGQVTRLTPELKPQSEFPQHNNGRTLIIDRFNAVLFPRHKYEKSASFCGLDNSVPNHRYTTKYCGVFHPPTSRNRWPRTPTAGFDTYEPETSSIIRGVRKKLPPSQDHGVKKGVHWKTP
ncbi:hypothetical protein TNCV_3503461 [Trichonephila clavipes]|uniref:Uncharacterized protein n=1 Tax=Trichonephila clavipes TaxID=2585209 RepID=A0A8X6VDU1_TRICX|nr:hypothetical protein TNCV_3503461 [Trichonephila clavipes]